MTATASLLTIPIGQLHESPWNPRRHFNEAKLAELATSIGAFGILTPLLARPIGDDGGWELAAGHRRFRASKLAGLTELPVLGREMTDVEFLEVLTIENLQREDVHALEEAQGYADLMKHAGYDVARIAERVGRSVRYVYDRMKLLQLIPELQQIFFDDEITVGHAILLSRLTPADQARALKETQALFTSDHGAHHRTAGETELAIADKRKPMSVRELQRWIDHHVRFDVEADHVPELFPETVAVVAPAIEQREKVIAITHNHHVDDSAKPEDGERTYGPQSWKRADGLHGSKTCDRSVTGVIVVGPGRGEAFKVCTDKKKCKTHWGAEMRDAAKRAKERESGAVPSAPKAPVCDAWAEQQARDNKAREQWKETLPAVLEAVAAKVVKMAAGAKGALGIMLIANTGGGRVKPNIPAGVTAEDLVRFLAFQVLADSATNYMAFKNFPKQAKAIGLDVAKIIAAVKPVDPNKPVFPKKPAAKKKAAR